MNTSEAREVNVPLLRKAVEWAEAEAAKPELECRWEQRYFVSEPRDRATLIAGDRLDQMGVDLEWTDYLHRRSQMAIELEPQCGTCYCIAGYVSQQYADAAELNSRPRAAIATDLLGLDGDGATALFDANNSIADVRRIAEDLAGERL